MKTYTKILIATQSINWMAFRLASVNEQIKQINHALTKSTEIDQKTKQVTIDSAQQHEDRLLEIAKQLHQIAEDFGDYLAARDCANSVDMAILNGSFDVMNEVIQED